MFPNVSATHTKTLDVIHLLLRLGGTDCVKPIEQLTQELAELSLDELTLIVDNHRNWYGHDILSARIIEWSIDFLSVRQDLNGLQEGIKVLANEILVNPIDGSPLSEPVFEDNIVWEKWNWEQMNPTFDPNHLKVHSFVVEIMRWKNSLPIVVEFSTCKGLDRNSFIQQDPQEKQLFFAAAKKSILAIQKMQHLQLKMKEDTIKLQLLWEENRESIIQNQRRVKESLRNLALQHQEEVQAHRNISEIIRKALESYQAELQMCQEEFHVLTEFIGNLNQRLVDLAKRLAETENTCHLQAGEIRQLRYQMMVEQAKITEIANKKDKGCVIA